jgi:filamentous hemagglutinin
LSGGFLQMAKFNAAEVTWVNPNVSPTNGADGSKNTSGPAEKTANPGTEARTESAQQPAQGEDERFTRSTRTSLEGASAPTASTTIDRHGFVTDVVQDGDLSIYQTQSGKTTKVGETLFPDAFVSPDTRGPVGRVILGAHITPYLMDKAAEALGLTTLHKNIQSLPGGDFDVKAVYPGHEGKSYQAGNILAGINAKSHGESFDQFMRGAGALQRDGARGPLLNQLLGRTYGSPPYYGEIPYTGTRVRYGYDLNPAIPQKPPREPGGVP